MSRTLALVESLPDPSKRESAPTPNALLATKLHVPRSRSGLVPRPRLIDAIRDGAAQKLTVVVAPAGFGKTTLLSAWLSDTAAAAGWVSLDPSENDPTLFWSYVIAALQKADPTLGARAMSLLWAPQPPPIDSVLTSLINDINDADRDFTLILDDYHVIDAAPIHDAMTFLLDHLPGRMRVVIASRAEPPLALPRLRARGELAELRVADLRFTNGEASAFLSEVMALDLSANDTATLEQRTEGWIAGLKLAALSIKRQKDTRALIDGFSGDNRYIADYLVEEVLQSEPEHIRRFLLSTAILDRLSGPLCDAVTGRLDSQSVLEDLERRNLFVVALDDRREWSRYHHLFADVLQKQSARTDPDAARACHRRASAWYESTGSFADGIRHALAAEDFERAAGMLERAWPEKNRSYESRKWLDRVKTLPNDVVRARPVLSMGYAWALINNGELEAAEPRLRDVEVWLQAIAEAGEGRNAATMIVSDEERLRSLPSELATARIYVAQSLGEGPGTVAHARRGLELARNENPAERTTATALLALALWANGDLEAAHRTFTDALAIMRDAGMTHDEIRGIFVLGDIRAAQGRLREAVRIYEQGLQLAVESGNPSSETDELHLGLSEVHREWNDLDAATEFLDAISRSAEQSAQFGRKLRWCTAMASVRAARGDLAGAYELLEEAERHERRDPVPRARPVAAMRARIRIAQGKMDDASAWATGAKLSLDDELSYLREFEHITLARLVLARSANDAVASLERLRTAAQTGGRIGSVIENLVLESLAQQALGNTRSALDSLAQALQLAEPEGFLRVFIDEGTRVRDLLRTATARGMAGEYARRVLLAFDARPQPVAPVAITTAAGAVQSLTTRELEILRHIAAGLRNQEIADHLAISAATVKRHIANAYGKLGAAHRTEALVRAKELKLL